MNTKFKVGDRVICKYSFSDHYEKHGTITKIGLSIHVTFDDGSKSHFGYESSLEKEKVTMFNIGDKVRYIGTVYKNSTTSQVGTITKHNPNKVYDYDVKFPNDSYHWHLPSKDLVKEDTTMDSRKEVELKLSNGAVIRGTPQQITQIAASLGVDQSDPKIWYKSSHLGKVLIANMTTEHIINAIKKIMREYSAVEFAVSKVHTKESLLKALQTTNHPSYDALVEELKRR